MRAVRTTALVVVSVVLGTVTPARGDVRFADVVLVEGTLLGRFDGFALDRLGVVACRQGTCTPIPFQIDERDGEGRWVLDQGPLANVDTPLAVLDANDVLLFMDSDAGEHVDARDLPGKGAAMEVAVADSLDGTTRFAYVVAWADAAPRSSVSYVQYDPATDRIHGSRATLGFVAGVPGYFAIRGNRGDADNLLERFEVHASATLLFGLLRFSRDESDLTTQFVGWRAGPIRVIRNQRQWVRLGWGIRSPTFGSYTYFYRDFAELPVGLRLNFPPTYFFGNIVIRVVLHFRDVGGWLLLLPSLSTALPIDGVMTKRKEAINVLGDSWFAILGPQLTLVQSMELGPSLDTVQHHLFYKEGSASVTTGESPTATDHLSVGYQLERWEGVGAGGHSLAAVSYALPADLDARTFMASRQVPLAVSVAVVAGRD